MVWVELVTIYTLASKDIKQNLHTVTWLGDTVPGLCACVDGLGAGPAGEG